MHTHTHTHTHTHKHTHTAEVSDGPDYDGVSSLSLSTKDGRRALLSSPAVRLCRPPDLPHKSQLLNH